MDRHLFELEKTGERAVSLLVVNVNTGIEELPSIFYNARWQEGWFKNESYQQKKVYYYITVITAIMRTLTRLVILKLT